MCRNWLIPLAPKLEERFPALPAGAITIRLQFPDIDAFDGSIIELIGPPRPPDVFVQDGYLVIECRRSYLLAFSNAANIGDRLMVSAVIYGIALFSGTAIIADDVHTLIEEVVRSDDARFFHFVPTRSIEERIFAALPPPRPRFQAPVDRAWSRFGLARVAGWIGLEAPNPVTEVRELLHRAVDTTWVRIRERLFGINRFSIIEKALLNHQAVQYDRSLWRMTAAAILALYRDTADVLRAAHDREVQRSLAGLASRVIAEMALCTSPTEGGETCADADLDFLIAEVGTMLECAGESDALHYGLISSPPLISGNGSFIFDLSFMETLQNPYIEAHNARAFRSAAAEYPVHFAAQGEAGSPDPHFDAAFAAEFGLGLRPCVNFVVGFAEEALRLQRSQFRIRKSEVLVRLREVGAMDPAKAYRAFTLAPRPRWDETRPKNASQRDWFPWRYNRRLSVNRRPLIQLSNDPDPEVLIVPAFLDSSFRYLCRAADGRLPAELFDSPAMTSCIGAAVDREGHEFNQTVAGKLRQLGWEARAEVQMSRFGGSSQLGDVDVICWMLETGVTFVIECKRLLFSRTVGEIGERLTEEPLAKRLENSV